ncbi:unnamed protein product [Sphenostylis stenocarpa]|uniref:Uncharacterized protein n=1 Tax=Sphenostylis stenocarpa TaxID=92480 RepID=A0AA86VVK6_9FABA|nr:unnamed protein product [Sphenostylis stenocarpa]
MLVPRVAKSGGNASGASLKLPSPAVQTKTKLDFQSSSSDNQEISKINDQPPELTNENEQNGDAMKESQDSVAATATALGAAAARAKLFGRPGSQRD